MSASSTSEYGYQFRDLATRTVAKLLDIAFVLKYSYGTSRWPMASIESMLIAFKPMDS